MIFLFPQNKYFTNFSHLKIQLIFFKNNCIFISPISSENLVSKFQIEFIQKHFRQNLKNKSLDSHDPIHS